MKKRLIIILIIILIICLIPIKKIYSDAPYTTYNAILYKYIKYDNDSVYNFEYKNELIVFPMNFKNTNYYFNNQIQRINICNNDEKNYQCVEMLLGKYEWNKKNNDEIFAIARNYKETLNTKNNQELTFNWSTNVKIDSVLIYDVNTTNTIKDKVNNTDASITFHDLEKGEYIISLRTISKYNDNNKVEYSFKINIED